MTDRKQVTSDPFSKIIAIFQDMYEKVFETLQEEMDRVGVSFPANFKMTCDWEASEVGPQIYHYYIAYNQTIKLFLVGSNI